jgi:hypothetical protein
VLDFGAFRADSIGEFPPAGSERRRAGGLRARNCGADNDMMKRITLLVMVLALSAGVAADAAQASGKISGTVRDAQGQPLPNAKLQLRNVDTGQIVARTRAGANASYEFTGIIPGNYVVEIVDDADKVLGLSAAAPLAASGAITGLVVALVSTTAAGGSFFASTAGILLLVGLGAGVTAGVIAVTNDASPSR